MTITKDFPLEDVLSFTTGRFISLKRHDMLDTSGILYQVANHMTGKQLDPFELQRRVDEVVDLIKAQHVGVDLEDIGEPVGGWSSLKGNVANTSVFIEQLCTKFGSKTLTLTGPDPLPVGAAGTMIVEL